MKIKLLNLIIQNFKGLQELAIDFAGNNTSIYGYNGTGKSTIFDAWTWLLFDKDSNGKTDFEIKTLDKNNKVINHLEHIVSAKIVVDDKEVVLKKIFTEKWTKKRGEQDATFTGHETQYWKGELPVTKREYDDFISSLVPENIFRIVSQPSFFNSMKWQDRRKMLFEISGEFDENEILKAVPEAAEIIDVIKEHGTDNFKKILVSRKAQINKSIKDIPTRIDELYKSTPALVENFEELKSDKETYESQIRNTDKKIEAFETERQDINKSVTEYNSKKFKLEDIKKKIEKEAYAAIDEMRRQKSTLKVQIEDKNNKIELFSKRVEQDKNDLLLNTEQFAEFGRKWHIENEKKFEQPDLHILTCPTCRQALPPGDAESKIEEMKTAFSDNKKKILSDLSTKGKNKKEEKVKLEAAIKEKEDAIESIKTEVLALEKDLENINAELEKNNTVIVNYEGNEEYRSLVAEIESFKAGEVDNEKIKELRESKVKLRGYINDIEQKLYSKTIVEQNKKRIEELQNEEKRLSEDFSNVERQEFLLESYIKAKTDLISEQINSKFELVKFKLFDVQVNGALNETCETMINGVPYTSNLNTAGKVQAGLDIIKTFARHYNVDVPVFLDNRETVVKIPQIKSQIINLYVSAEDKKIRVEVA
jgi:DNA repair exonuclease SbcCD ATPase subunit